MAKRVIGSFTPEQCQMLWQDYQERRQLPAQLQKQFPDRPAVDDPGQHRIFVYNASGEEVPPYACMQIDGTYEGPDDLTYIRVIKPDTLCGEYMFNGPHEIDADGYGWGYRFGLVIMQGNASSYNACNRYAPVVGQWYVTDSPGPFLVYGPHTAGDNCVVGRIVGESCRAKWIKFAYDPEGSGSVTADAWYDGANPNNCEITVAYPLGEPCVPCNVIAFWDPNTGNYQAIATENAMLGLPSTMDVITAVAMAGCGLAYISQGIKAVPCGGDPVVGSSTPALTYVPVLTSAAIATESHSCSSTCTFIFDGVNDPAGEWRVYRSYCDAGCECPPAPASPPSGGLEAPLEDRIYEAACVSASPTSGSLVFNQCFIGICDYGGCGLLEIPIEYCE